MGIDFSEFDSFVKRHAEMTAEFNQFLKDYLNRIALEVVEQTKMRTPTDTGALQNSWIIGEIQGDGNEISVEIINGMDYASFVEYGHAGVYVPSLGVTLHTSTRWTAGRYMLTISLDEAEEKMQEVFDLMLHQLMKKHGLD